MVPWGECQAAVKSEEMFVGLLLFSETSETVKVCCTVKVKLEVSALLYYYCTSTTTTTDYTMSMNQKYTFLSATGKCLAFRLNNTKLFHVMG